MVDFYSVLSPIMTTQKKILPAGLTFNPSSFLSQSPDFLKPGLFLGLVTGTAADFRFLFSSLGSRSMTPDLTPGASPRLEGRLANLRKRQDFAPCANFVASIMPCRNNSGKISPKFLESGKSRCTFASSIRQNKFWETQTDN